MDQTIDFCCLACHRAVEEHVILGCVDVSIPVGLRHKIYTSYRVYVGQKRAVGNLELPGAFFFFLNVRLKRRIVIGVSGVFGFVVVDVIGPHTTY